MCVNFTDLTKIVGGATIASWNWHFGDGDSSISPNPNHCYNNPGVYSVSLSVTTSEGCTGSYNIPNYITAYPHPIAHFTYSPNPVYIMEPTVNFTDQSTDPNPIVNWVWTFGDGTDSAGVVKDPTHTYKDTGRYCINLQVTDVHGCTADTMQCLDVEPYFVIYVPNAFIRMPTD